MNTVCKALLVVIGLMLGGCASTPKPVLSEEMMQSTAANFAYTHNCGSQGFISPELAAEGIRILRINLTQYTYDVSRMSEYIQYVSANAEPTTKEYCNKLAMVIAERKQRIIANQQASDYNQQQEQAFINSTRTKNTYCNTIGTQTFCNTN